MSRAEETLRAFVAIRVSPAAVSVLEEAIRVLEAQLPREVRWVNPDGIHLTLKFLGNIAPHQARDVLDVMGRSAAAVEPFSIGLSDLGMFPNPKRPRVVWAGIRGEVDPLQKLQAGLERGAWELGLSKETRPFSPHLTLGRVREQASESAHRSTGAVISATPLGASEPWRVEAVHLIRSRLGPGGAKYCELGSARLGNG